MIAVDICGPVTSVGYDMSSADDLAETPRLVEALDRRIVARTADVRDRTALEAAFAGGSAEFGRIYIVCANAGIAPLVPAAELDDRTWQDMIDINLTGAWRTVSIALPRMI